MGSRRGAIDVRLEVIASTLEDGIAAEAGGADRLEVVRELDRGGLTPAIALVEALIARVRLQAAPEVVREDCFVDPADAFDAAGALDGDEALVMLECWRGAYQSSSLLFRTRRDGSGTAVRVRLPLPVRIEGERRMVDAFTNVDFSAGHLSHMAKGRGIADCGESASWTYDGRDFRLQRYHLLDRCRGGEPGDWPALWRTRGD